MAAGDLYLYVAIFRIDGVAHTFRGHTATKAGLTKNLKAIIDSRNANIPEEKSEIKEDEIFFKVTEEQAKELEDRVRAANQNNSVAQELSPLAPNLILHKPVAELRNEKQDTTVAGVAADLK